MTYLEHHNVNGHNLNTCFNTTRILWEAKFRQSQGANSQSDQPHSSRQKRGKSPKPPAKAGQTSIAHLGGSFQADEEESNYSGSKIAVTTHQAVCSLFSLNAPQSTGDLNLNSGCSMTMLPDSLSLTKVQNDSTPVHLADQSTVEATSKGLFHLPLDVKTNIKALVVPALHEPLLLVSNLCNNNLCVIFDKTGCKIVDSVAPDKVVGQGYRRGNLYYLPAEPVNSHSTSIPLSSSCNNSLMIYHLRFSHVGLKPLKTHLRQLDIVCQICV
jgi:hypothetical protein